MFIIPLFISKKKEKKRKRQILWRVTFPITDRFYDRIPSR